MQIWSLRCLVNLTQIDSVIYILLLKRNKVEREIHFLVLLKKSMSQHDTDTVCGDVSFLETFHLYLEFDSASKIPLICLKKKSRTTMKSCVNKAAKFVWAYS